MHRYLLPENARRDADMMAQGLTLESYSAKQKFQEREKADVSLIISCNDSFPPRRL